ncbi:MAG TPA: DUF664 domain-containing protein [Acidimicrobiia bacterium]|nr:DUF664 domain-containing protein [Acidimicrobiia bacterium]
MDDTAVLIDGFGRVHEEVHAAVDGLSPEQLTVRLDAAANTIAWLAWHLTRIQDDHIADVAGHEDVWLADGWRERFALPFEPHATGYGHTSEDVGAVRADAALLLAYFDAVHERTIGYLRTIEPNEMERIVDDRWDPPVTLAVRLVSVLSDDLQHAGQAAYVRGIIERR